MDYFGWTLSKNLFLGNSGHLKAMGITDQNPEEFEPDNHFWTHLFTQNTRIMQEAKINEQMGQCFHLTNGAGELLVNLQLTSEYTDGIENYSFPHGFELGLHSTHRPQDIICEKGFQDALKSDLNLGKNLNISALVEHAPLGTENKTREAVDLLCSKEICEWLSDVHYPLCWENKASYRLKPRYYGSPKEIVKFLDLLYDGLDDAGYPELKAKHLITFDTGHLLIWRNNSPNKKDIEKCDNEILEYLPQFAQKIKVFHFQVNDGILDQHFTPFSQKYLTEKSRQGLTPQMLQENSQKILEWMKICEQNKAVEGRHIHLETATLPYDLNQYLEFAKHYQSLI